MFGHRTPVKQRPTGEAVHAQRSQSPKAHSSNSTSVRRSVGEWETGKLDAPTKTLTMPKIDKTVEPSKPKLKTTIPQIEPGALIRTTSAEVSGSPPKQKYKDRLTEAKACLTKAKSNLANSRNIKAEIKAEVLVAVERLFQLVKEAELVKRSGKSSPEEGREQGQESEGIRKESDQTEIKILEEQLQILKLQLERANSLRQEDLLRLEKEHARYLGGLVESMNKNDISAPVGEVLAEVKSLRQMISLEVVDKLTNMPGKLSQCDRPHNIDQLLGELREIRQVTEETGRQVTSLQEGFPSYADVLSRPGSNTAVKTLPNHSIIVSSDTEKDTSDEVLGKVRQVLDAKTCGFQVQRVRKIKNQKVILSCSNRDEMTKMAAKLKGGNLKVEEARNKDPLVIIKDLLSFNTDDDIIASLKTQNAVLLRDLAGDELKATVRYRRRARNPHENHVVLQVSPRMWQRLTSAGRIHIDLQNVVVQDQSPLVQCTRCLGYGHGRRLCKEPADLCSFCGGTHLRADCPSYSVGDTPTCRNCRMAKYNDIGHNAFDRDCPIRRKWEDIARSSVAYC